MRQAFDNTHVVIGIDADKFYPLLGEDSIIGKGDTEIQGHAEKNQDEYTGYKSGGNPQFIFITLQNQQPTR